MVPGGGGGGGGIGGAGLKGGVNFFKGGFMCADVVWGLVVLFLGLFPHPPPPSFVPKGKS